MRITDFFDSLKQDLRYAARCFARRPGFTVVAVLTLAIGIGGTTAMFSAVNALLFHPLPYAAPEQLMAVSLTAPAMGGMRAHDDMPWSYAKYRVFRGAQSSFSNISLYMARDFTVTGGEAKLVQGEFVGARYLRTLGLAPAWGRDFDPAIDAHPGAERQVIISYALWQRRYNADSAVIRKTLDMDGKPYVVIGVAPAGFPGLTGHADVFVPITTRPADDLSDDQAEDHEFFMVVRRKRGIGVAAAIADVKLLGARVNDGFAQPDEPNGHWGATARPLDAARVSPLMRRSLLIALGAVGLVLLIACVNVANLLLGRASMRRREISVRLALGASRWRLARLLLTESLLLATLGGVAGIAVAWFGVGALRAVDPSMMIPKGNDTLNWLGTASFSGSHIDWATLAFTASLTILVGITFGLIPALHASRAALVDAMKAVGGESDAQQRGAAGRRTLVVIEVALATILLAGSGLLMRSFGKLMAVDPGFVAQNVLTMRLAIPQGAFVDDSMPPIYTTELVDRLRAIPGVVDASLNSCPPLAGGCLRTPIMFPDRPKRRGAALSADLNWATPTWFATLRVPLERGRLFGSSDRAGAPKVVVINETAARTYWPAESALGKRVIVANGGAAQVVGIVGDVRQFADSLAKPVVYLPLAQYAQSHAELANSRTMIFIRTVGSPSAVMASVRSVTQELVPRYPVYDVQPLTVLVAGATSRARFTVVLLGIFGATALSLAVIGIYGVMALAVTARTREIGIRIALGADQRMLRYQVVRQGAALVLVGVIVGLVGALGSTRVLRTLLFDLSPMDPLTYCGIVAVLGVAAVGASWIPARRASSVDPVVALRAD